MILTALCLTAGLCWSALLLLPFRPWSVRDESLQPDPGAVPQWDPDVAVLIPARNESGVLPETLAALRAAGGGADVGPRALLVDDCSTDNTAALAEAARWPGLQILRGTPPPSGWKGKPWAMEQGWRALNAHPSPPELVLFLDADVRVDAALPAALAARLRQHQLDLVSVLATPRFRGFWERLLMPAYVYFFKLLYPFSLSNRPGGRIAGAAGGCLLIRATTLARIGGPAAIRAELIDDCALAARVKAAGGRTWLGLTRHALSRRGHGTLAEARAAVTRTAYAWLRHSPVRLLPCTALMMLLFAIPPTQLVVSGWPAGAVGLAAWLLMTLSYIPVVRYYRLNVLWALSLPAAGILYMLMTLESAARYYWGNGAAWKGRRYPAGEKPA